MGLDGKLKSGKILIISTTFRDSFGKSINKLFTYDQYKTERELLESFCNYLRECNPSVVTGHNIIGFDFPYLKARCEVTGAKLSMGRNDSEVKFNRYDSKFRLDGTRDLLYKNISIYGREVVDTFFLVTSFDVGKTFESHALKPLIKQLGFEKEGRQYYDAGSIKDHYKNPTEWKKIKDYAESDAEDAIKLFDHMAPLYFNMCPMIPKPFSEILLTASGSKINALLVRAYLQDKHSIPKATPTEAFQGALSFAVSGIYNNCFKIDIASLYPNIIVNYEVFDIDKDPKGYLLELVKSFKESRLKLKKLAAETGDPLYKQMDTTTKGILNSFFGFFSAAGLNFNSPECGSFITAKGRELLGVTIKWASGKEVSEFVHEGEEEDESA
jgi:DNA polymerase elongation subunit (family B)